MLEIARHRALYRQPIKIVSTMTNFDEVEADRKYLTRQRSMPSVLPRSSGNCRPLSPITISRKDIDVHTTSYRFIRSDSLALLIKKPA